MLRHGFVALVRRGEERPPLGLNATLGVLEQLVPVGAPGRRDGGPLRLRQARLERGDPASERARVVVARPAGLARRVLGGRDLGPQGREPLRGFREFGFERRNAPVQRRAPRVAHRLQVVAVRFQGDELAL